MLRKNFVMEPSPISSTPGIDTRARQRRSSKGAEIIKQRIKQGVYKAGEQLPSLRALSSELNLSLPSVQRAVQQLEREAIVESRHGVGIRILEDADCASTPFLFGFVQPYFSRFSLSLQHYLEQALDNRSNLGIVKSTHNSPARERQEIERLIKSDINGLLLWPVDGDTNGEFLREVTQRLPVVFVDRTLDDVPSLSVVLDYEDGARKIVRKLHQTQHHRILMICEPADISSFKQLKRGMRDEVEKLGSPMQIEIIDYPVVQLIESAYRSDYELADSCYEFMAPLLKSGKYDALFCPQSEFYDQVFAESGHPYILADIHCVTLRIPDGPPHSRSYQKIGIEEWVLDISGMLVRALDTLQDVVSMRSSPKGIIRMPLYQKE
jgi:DNA-binding transcriptional regulator YhcF (GntR family)